MTEDWAESVYEAVLRAQARKPKRLKRTNAGGKPLDQLTPRQRQRREYYLQNAERLRAYKRDAYRRRYSN